MLEERLRVLEGAEVCRATSSGMAAVFAAMASYLESGDRVLVTKGDFTGPGGTNAMKIITVD